MANTVITAEIRERAGKGAARAVRRAGMVPGVIYGAKQEPVLFQIDPRPLNKLLHKQGFFSHILDVKIGKETYEVLPRDVQFDKVTDAPIHVDFLRFAKGQTMTVEVPVRFVNEEKSPGLKKRRRSEHRSSRCRSRMRTECHSGRTRLRSDWCRSWRLDSHFGNQTAERCRTHHYRP